MFGSLSQRTPFTKEQFYVPQPQSHLFWVAEGYDCRKDNQFRHWAEY